MSPGKARVRTRERVRATLRVKASAGSCGRFERRAVRLPVIPISYDTRYSSFLRVLAARAALSIWERFCRGKSRTGPGSMPLAAASLPSRADRDKCRTTTFLCFFANKRSGLAVQSDYSRAGLLRHSPISALPTMRTRTVRGGRALHWTSWRFGSHRPDGIARKCCLVRLAPISQDSVCPSHVP